MPRDTESDADGSGTARSDTDASDTAKSDADASHSFSGDTERRFLIATAVAHYRHDPCWNRPGLAAARKEIIDLFTGPMGYEHVGDLGLDPTREQLTTRLREFCRSPERRSTDLLTVYIACHGEVLEGSGDHVLLTADTDPEDIADALPTAELARKMLLGTRVRRVLLMLGTCYSGRGGNELTAAALTRMAHSWERTAGSGLVVITSAQPAESRPGPVRRASAAAGRGGPAHGRPHPSALAMDAVVSAMNADVDRPGFQTIGASLSLLTGEVPPFLPNPRHRSGPTEVDLAIQRAGEWEVQDERRANRVPDAVADACDGIPGPARGWWFLGRHTALTDITRWLAHPEPGRPLLAVTAAPGSGKTAVLGLIATLADPDRRATVPLHALGLPPSAVPSAGAVDVAIYAQALTMDQVLRGISAATRAAADTLGSLLEALSRRADPLTVLIDALDEAGDPEHLVRRLLRLADHARGRLRLLVGTRPHLLKDLGLQRDDSIDLDGPRHADLDALTAYAARGLLDSAADSPYRRQPPRRSGPWRGRWRRRRIRRSWWPASPVAPSPPTPSSPIRRTPRGAGACPGCPATRCARTWRPDWARTPGGYGICSCRSPSPRGRACPGKTSGPCSPPVSLK
ncbi:hypothetical protein [Streptomyces sp. NPDC059455]|uniref:hypothetical protein n=1 Tax=Streptomyces sp. NPDC059455 TaxID=3346837 RepID=UPI00367811A8